SSGSGCRPRMYSERYCSAPSAYRVMASVRWLQGVVEVGHAQALGILEDAAKMGRQLAFEFPGVSDCGQLGADLFRHAQQQIPQQAARGERCILYGLAIDQFPVAFACLVLGQLRQVELALGTGLLE